MACAKLMQVLIVALALAMGATALGGCGGDGEGTASTSAVPTTTPGGSTVTPTSPQSPDDSAEGDSRGGEASIEDFGSEAEGSEREAILSTFMGYLGAIAKRDYASACPYLSETVKESLSRFSGKEEDDCAAALTAILTSAAAQIAREQAGGEVKKVRVEGERAFVIFEAPGAKLYQQTMAGESGVWQADTLAAAVLVPEL